MLSGDGIKHTNIFSNGVPSHLLHPRSQNNRGKSGVNPISSGGVASFTYWIIAGALFFLPCSLVVAQLAALFPQRAGSLYTWTYHALGSGWSFFVGVCAWLPVVLSMVNATAGLISCLHRS